MTTPNEIQRCIEEVPGAKVTNIEENGTYGALGDLPPFSMRFTVDGGDDRAIAEAMFGSWPLGVEAIGDIEVDLGVRDGLARLQRFSRPKTGQADPKSGRVEAAHE